MQNLVNYFFHFKKHSVGIAPLCFIPNRMKFKNVGYFYFLPLKMYFPIRQQNKFLKSENLKLIIPELLNFFSPFRLKFQKKHLSLRPQIYRILTVKRWDSTL